MYLEAHPTEPVLYAALEGAGVWKWDVRTAAAPDVVTEPTLETQLFVYPVPSAGRFIYGMRLSRPEHVVVRLFDTQGRFVEKVNEGFFPVGTHVFECGEGLHLTTNGIYYITLDTGERQERQKIVLLK